MLPVRSLVDKSFKYQRRIRKAAKVPHIKQFFVKKIPLHIQFGAIQIYLLTFSQKKIYKYEN